MSWFNSSGSSSQIDEKVNVATSESIPNGEIDFIVALEISDLIRSKQVASKDAMRALKKRFVNNKNPNLQKSSLKLIDFCIKNGGEHFLTDISSKEFMDPIVAKLSDKHLNASVKSYMLELIQSWSIMFSTNPKLGYVNQCYTKLQNEDFQFPMITDIVDSSLIESKVAPEWEDSDACMMCSTLFSFLNRKHHCRSCGGVFCNTHSSKSCELPELGITIPVRVCDTCYHEHKNKLKKHKKKSKSVSFPNSDATGSVAAIGEEEDEELRKAIELSLKESGVQLSTSAGAAKSGPSRPDPKEFEDGDEDMKAAIAASLADFKGQEAISQTTTDGFSPQGIDGKDDGGMYANLLPVGGGAVEIVSLPNVNSASIEPVANNYFDYNVVTSVEEENIVLFAQLLSNIEKAPIDRRKSIASDTVLNNLHNNILRIQPKITDQKSQYRRTLEKYEEIYSKTFAISKVYEEILETRLNQQHSYKPQYAPEYRQQQQISPQHGPPNSYSPSQMYSQPPPNFQLSADTQPSSSSRHSPQHQHVQIGYQNPQPPAYTPVPNSTSPFSHPSPMADHKSSSRLPSVSNIQYASIPNLGMGMKSPISSSPQEYQHNPTSPVVSAKKTQEKVEPSSPSQLYPSSPTSYPQISYASIPPQYSVEESGLYEKNRPSSPHMYNSSLTQQSFTGQSLYGAPANNPASEVQQPIVQKVEEPVNLIDL